MKLFIKLITTVDEVPMRLICNPHTNKMDGEWRQILAPIHISINGKLVIIPRGFCTNLGSIPKILRNFVDKGDTATLAFIVHDYLYGAGSFKFGRKDTDIAMRKIADLSKQNYVEKWAAYIGVRVAGWAAYKKKALVFKPIPSNILYNIIYNTYTTKD